MIAASASSSSVVMLSRDAASSMVSFIPTDRSYVVVRVLHQMRVAP